MEKPNALDIRHDKRGMKMLAIHLPVKLIKEMELIVERGFAANKAEFMRVAIIERVIKLKQIFPTLEVEYDGYY